MVGTFPADGQNAEYATISSGINILTGIRIQITLQVEPAFKKGILDTHRLTIDPAQCTYSGKKVGVSAKAPQF